MDETNDILILLLKYRRGDISDAELRELVQWADSHPRYKEVLADFSPGRYGSAEDQDLGEFHASGESLSFDRLLERIEAQRNRVRGRQRSWMAVAASLLLIGVVGAYLLFMQQDANLPGTPVVSVVPGSKKAMLVADGGVRQAMLDDAGLFVSDSGMFYADGRAVSEAMGTVDQQLSLVVPRGAEYQVTLPDGTRVWLNSESTLRFPGNFASEERVVEIVGEAYFEVHRDTRRPFVVKSNYQRITVLGTSFNVKAYAADNLNTTTLVEGAVRVQSSDGAAHISLNPGEGSVVGYSQKLRLAEHDVQQAISWKHGEFSFNQTPFEEVIKQISRWYNLDVEYRSGIPNEYFTGQLNRAVDFQIVLEFLRSSRIDLELLSNKLIIN